MSRPPRFLYVANHAGHFIIHHLSIVRALKEAGYEVHIAAPGTPDALEQVMVTNARALIERDGFPFHPIPLKRGKVNLAQEMRTLYSLYRLYSSLEPDLVYHATIKPVIYGGLVSRIAGVPAAINAVTGLGHTFLQNGTKASFFRKFLKLAYRVALGHKNSKVIFQHADDRRIFVDNDIVEPKRTIVIPGSGVDLNVFKFLPEPDNEIPLVAMASRMIWSKGVGVFVEAATKLREAKVNARFVLVGDSDPGNPEAISHQQLMDWHNSHVIEWWGWQRDMPGVFKQTNIFCLPSFYPEGIPKVLIEAAASGRAIVTTDAPGCREVVRGDMNGLLVPRSNVEKLADSLRMLLEDRELRQRMSVRSREIAEAEFREEVVTKAVVETCNQLLKR